MREHVEQLDIEPDERIFKFTKHTLYHEMKRGRAVSGVKRIRIHDLRHSHVSMLINMGFTDIEHYLERRGNEILAKDWAHGSDHIDFVIKDDEEDAIAFVTCEITENGGEGFPEEKLNRESMERVAIAFLAANPDNTDCTVRFDHLHMLVIGESRALIRHHKGCMSHDLI